MRALIGLSLLVLAGCSSEAKRAERQYEIVKSDPAAKSADVCAAGRAVAEAYLKAENAGKYRDATGRAAIECLKAQLDEQSAARAAALDESNLMTPPAE